MFNWLKSEKKIEISKNKKKGFYDDPLTAFPAERDREIIVSAITRTLNAINAMPKWAPAAEGKKTDARGSVWAEGISFEDFDTNGQEALLAWFLRQTYFGHQVNALLGQNPMIIKCCHIPARDAVRQGWTIALNGIEDDDQKSEIISMMERFDKKINIRQQLIDYIYFGRLFGVRHLYYQFAGADPLFYELPFNPHQIKPHTYRGMVQIDPYWLYPSFGLVETSDPSSPDFYQPTVWRVRNLNIHKTNMSIYRHVEIADILKPIYRFGGIGLPQMLLDRLYYSERTCAEAPWLLMSKRMTVWKTDTTSAALRGTTFLGKLLKFSQIRDNTAIKVIDEGDEIQQFDTSLTGFDEITQTLRVEIAAIANVPITKLYGVQAKGYSNGENDESNYHEGIKHEQDNKLQTLLLGHYERFVWSEIYPKYGITPDDLDMDIIFKELDVRTAEEQANVEKIRTESLINAINMGAIDRYEARDIMRSDDDSLYAQLSEIKEEDEEFPLPDSPIKPASNGQSTEGALALEQKKQGESEE